ncbi:MAG: hypothetical protein OXB87_03170 [Hyphomicrobiales bacterium]|nr:hypothetical protein [Hyphomicrobiales bacterium]
MRFKARKYILQNSQNSLTGLRKDLHLGYLRVAQRSLPTRWMEYTAGFEGTNFEGKDDVKDFSIKNFGEP